jgi:hypothetical protein
MNVSISAGGSFLLAASMLARWLAASTREIPEADN